MKTYKITTSSRIISEMFESRGHSVSKDDIETAIRECIVQNKSSLSVKDFKIVFVDKDSYKSISSDSENDVFICIGNKEIYPMPIHLPAEQIFHIDYFMFNISHHILVPKHELLIRDSEKKKRSLFLAYLNIDESSQLPLLYTVDPVAKYYGMKNGDICKITRPNYVSYRYVVRN